MTQGPPTENQSQPPSTVLPAAPVPSPKPAATNSKQFISLAAFAVLVSFFLPWTTFLGTGISGTDIQKGGDQFYRFVWIMPFLAVVTLILNLAGKSSDLVRRLAGIFPFVILFYSMREIGADIFKLLSYGAWLGLLGAAVLICIPSRRATSPKV
jgi:hypothetical protein